MADGGGRLAQFREKILSANGTVLDRVEGEVELDDTDAEGRPRTGPVLVLGNIEKGSVLRLAHPRVVTVLGSLSGQVFGAYRIKVGNLLSGRLEGSRNVEVVHHLGSIGDTNEDAWVVFEATSDPGFFRQAQGGLDKLREIENNQRPQRESTAQMVLLRGLANSSLKIEVSVTVRGQQRRVFQVRPGHSSRPIQADLKPLLLYLFQRTDQGRVEPKEMVEIFKTELRNVIKTSLQRINGGGMGAGLRRAQGDDVYDSTVERVHEYVLPKLMRMWLKISESFAQKVVDRLADAPMVLKVGGDIRPFFQVEYPRWRFHVVGSRIEPEKIADCNIACAAGSSRETLSLTYSYIGGEQFHTDMKELALAETRNRSIILRNGSVYLSGDDKPLFEPPPAEDA